MARLKIPEKMRNTPAGRFVVGMGGVRKAARALGIDPSWVSRWLKAFPAGTGGRIPGRQQARVLELSRKHDLGLTADDLVGTVTLNKRA